jgi:hypothetical protein
MTTWIRSIVAALILGASVGAAHAQNCTGVPGANQVCAGPSTGPSGFGRFRALTVTDVPPSPSGIVYAASQPNVSASGQSTTGTISGSSASLALGSAIDFQNGQGIRINHAGAAFTAGQPSGASATPTGATGSTTYTYTVASIDINGGVGAAIANFSTSTGNATLSQTNYNALSWSAGSGSPIGYAVYGRISGSLQIIALVPTTTFNDTGFPLAAAPDWLPSTPPGAALADWLVTTISSGGGTTNLTLAATATTGVSGGFVRHDDTVALQAALTLAETNSQRLFINSSATAAGSYWISSMISTGGSQPIEIFGEGYNTSVINLSSPCQNGLQINNNSGYNYLHDFKIMFPPGGAGVFQVCGTMMNVTGGSANVYEQLFLYGGYICLTQVDFSFRIDKIIGSCSSAVFSWTTSGDSSLTNSLITPLSLPGSTNGIGAAMTGDPGGMKILNNKFIGSGIGSMNSAINVNATIADGDFFVIGNSIENFTANGILFATSTGVAFGNPTIIGNEIASGTTTNANAIQFSGATGGTISQINVIGNVLEAGGAAAFGIAMSGLTKKFTIEGNSFLATTGILVAAGALNCMIGINTFVTTTQITDSSGACTYAQITASKPTYPFLLRRDLGHDNDNRPMWLNAAG